MARNQHGTRSPRRMRVGAAFALGLIVVLAAACSSDAKSSTPFTGTEWTLITATGLGVDLGSATVTATFSDNTVSGNGGCNQYNGPATVDGSALTIGPNLASTQMACPALDVEAGYMKLLPTVVNFEIKGKTLTLKNDKDTAILVYDTP